MRVPEMVEKAPCTFTVDVACWSSKMVLWTIAVPVPPVDLDTVVVGIGGGRT